MAEKNDIKTPPALRGDLLTETWKKENNFATHSDTGTKETSIGFFLSLEGKAREAVLEIDIESLNKEVDVKKVLAQFDKSAFER